MTHDNGAPQARMWRMVAFGVVLVIALAALFVAVAR